MRYIAIGLRPFCPTQWAASVEPAHNIRSLSARNLSYFWVTKKKQMIMIIPMYGYIYAKALPCCGKMYVFERDEPDGTLLSNLVGARIAVCGSPVPVLGQQPAKATEPNHVRGIF